MAWRLWCRKWCRKWCTDGMGTARITAATCLTGVKSRMRSNDSRPDRRCADRCPWCAHVPRPRGARSQASYGTGVLREATRRKVLARIPASCPVSHRNRSLPAKSNIKRHQRGENNHWTANGVTGVSLWWASGSPVLPGIARQRRRQVVDEPVRKVLPADGHTTGVLFGDSIQHLVSVRVPSPDKFRAVFAGRGGLPEWVKDPPKGRSRTPRHPTIPPATVISADYSSIAGWIENIRGPLGEGVVLPGMGRAHSGAGCGV